MMRVEYVKGSPVENGLISVDEFERLPNEGWRRELVRGQEEKLGFDPEKFAPLAPDFAVEIVSPSDRVSEILAKVMDYLEAGTRLVWLVEPRSKSVTAYRSKGDVHLLTGKRELDAGPVLPGLRLKVSELFR